MTHKEQLNLRYLNSSLGRLQLVIKNLNRDMETFPNRDTDHDYKDENLDTSNNRIEKEFQMNPNSESEYSVSVHTLDMFSNLNAQISSISEQIDWILKRFSEKELPV